MDDKLIINRVSQCETVNYKDLKVIQGDLKDLTKDKYTRFKKQIIKNGITSPVHVWDDQGVLKVLDGTQRKRLYGAMEEEGYHIPQVPIVRITADSEKQAKNILLGLASQYGEVNSDGLYAFALEAGVDFDELRSDFAFPEINFDKFEKEFSPEVEGNTEDDAIPDAAPERAKLGDVFALGNHRLMCGDSTDLATVQKLMNGEKADLIFTDPPYGLGDKKSFNKDHADYSDDVAFDLEGLAFDADFVIWGANYYETLPAPRTEIGWVVWDKRPTRETWDQETRDAADRIFGQRFEIAATNVSGIRGKMIRKTWGGFYGTAGNKDDEIVHKTQKPIELITHFLTKDHKNVLDYFGGSGSTLIACEKAGRKCFMIELMPTYCDVILKRWEDFTGLKAHKIESDAVKIKAKKPIKTHSKKTKKHG